MSEQRPGKGAESYRSSLTLATYRIQQLAGRLERAHTMLWCARFQNQPAGFFGDFRTTVLSTFLLPDSDEIRNAKSENRTEICSMSILVQSEFRLSCI